MEELVFRQGQSVLIARENTPCKCSNPDCKMGDKIAEITNALAPETAKEFTSRYAKEGEGQPLIMPFFVTAAEARKIAAQLYALADKYDPHGSRVC